MKKIYPLLTGLFIAEIIMAVVCGPHSCEWGNQVYFYFGIFCLIASFAIAFFRKGWLVNRKTGFGFLYAFISVIVWIACFMLCDFRIMCRLF